mmetsp:Transcript_9054/g.28259  ORF Transcript_9054/g.28259 Transcript_9054/m.28259 type:complete len:217 (-) Transcript_9054:8-658(-)
MRCTSGSCADRSTQLCRSASASAESRTALALNSATSAEAAAAVALPSASGVPPWPLRNNCCPQLRQKLRSFSSWQCRECAASTDRSSSFARWPAASSRWLSSASKVRAAWIERRVVSEVCACWRSCCRRAASSRRTWRFWRNSRSCCSAVSSLRCRTAPCRICESSRCSRVRACAWSTWHSCSSSPMPSSHVAAAMVGTARPGGDTGGAFSRDCCA